ncbi:hypothetical protein D3C73_1602050 [compost metagenome]
MLLVESADTFSGDIEVYCGASALPTLSVTSQPQVKPTAAVSPLPLATDWNLV